MNTTRVVHCKREPYDVYIGRAAGERGKWGNPFTHLPKVAKRDGMFLAPSRDDAVEMYEEWLERQPALRAALPELKGKVLGCWCAPNPCHGDVLARLAEEA